MTNSNHMSLQHKPQNIDFPSMESNSIKLLIFLLCSFILTSHGRLSLDRSDHNAFKLIRNDLGFTGQRHPSHTQKTCNHAGVICERRVSNFSSILRITRLVFESQHLEGSISPAVGKLSELRELTLGDNHLFGQLPAELAGCRKLEILNITRNRFSGQVPSELSKLVQLRVLDLSSNRFSGDLSFLKHFPNLEVLSLDDNLLSGKIPSSLRSFRNLRSFSISGNDHIEGPIPNLQGVEHVSTESATKTMVPRRYIFAENKNSSAKTNRSRAASPNIAPSPSSSTSNKHHKKHKKTKEWLFGFLAGATVGGATGLLFSLLVKVLVVIARERKKNGMSIFSPLIKNSEDLEFLTKEDGLANMEMIGRGGCGEVYKAELPGSNGKMIAIKKIIQPPKEAAELADEESKQLTKKLRQVKSEIQTVGQVRHRNLLPLLAHVSRPDCHLLVYEFMKNGSLQDMLNQVSAGTRELDWLTRHNIALGVASGLEYLHINNTPKIIHRDLKPANILLDDDMEARIADFGLAKPMPDAETHMSSSNVAGTAGYIAPEYHQTFKFTEKCDVYSFGVVLGVLVMGRLPSDEFFITTEDVGLVKWMRKVMVSDDPKKAIDSKLQGNGYEEQMLQVLKIACFCTVDNPKERPNSKEIRLMLSQIKHVEALIV